MQVVSGGVGVVPPRFFGHMVQSRSPVISNSIANDEGAVFLLDYRVVGRAISQIVAQRVHGLHYFALGWLPLVNQPVVSGRYVLHLHDHLEHLAPELGLATQGHRQVEPLRVDLEQAHWPWHELQQASQSQNWYLICGRLVHAIRRYFSRLLSERLEGAALPLKEVFALVKFGKVAQIAWPNRNTERNDAGLFSTAFLSAAQCRAVGSTCTKKRFGVCSTVVWYEETDADVDDHLLHLPRQQEHAVVVNGVAGADLIVCSVNVEELRSSADR